VSEAVLLTRLYIPPLRPNLVPRQRLIERLNQGLQSGRIFTLVSAPAGFGKTTLVSAWAQQANLDAALFRMLGAARRVVRPEWVNSLRIQLL